MVLPFSSDFHGSLGGWKSKSKSKSKKLSRPRIYKDIKCDLTTHTSQLGHLDCFYPAAPPPGSSVESLEVFVQQVSGGPEGDNEPANHHRDGSRQVHGLVEQSKLHIVVLLVPTETMRYFW